MRTTWLTACLLTFLAVPPFLLADEPLAERFSMEGPLRAEPFGAVLAEDTDMDNSVDTLLPAASINVGGTRVADGETLLAGFLYWSGSMEQTGAACGDPIDNSVEFTMPGGTAETIVADACFCTDGGASAYDVFSCRAEVSMGNAVVTGDYQVSGVNARITNSAADNASTSLVLIIEDSEWRHVSLLDGIETLTHSSTDIAVSGSSLSDVSGARLAYHVLDGDIGGSTGESVQAESLPGGSAVELFDSINPAGNPMNHTVNLDDPARTDTIGLDLDRFDIPASALALGDSTLQMTFTASSDKWWLVWGLVEYPATEPLPDAIFADRFE